MTADAATTRAAWESFYVIVGSSGGALIGLQFVVITLIADRREMATRGGLSAFGTPTVVHLTGALVLSAVMSAPWSSGGALALTMGAIGVAGAIYCLVVARRAGRQRDYRPVLEDWLWYVIFPSVSYAALACTAVFLRRSAADAFFVVAAAALGLLLIGIHNAWDTVTHIVMSGSRDDNL